MAAAVSEVRLIDGGPSADLSAVALAKAEALAKVEKRSLTSSPEPGRPARRASQPAVSQIFNKLTK